jgi:hypothetical protein
MGTGTDDLAAVAGLLADRARLLAAHAAGAEPAAPEPRPDAGTPGTGTSDAAADLAMVRLTKELGAVARTALRLAVARAQADGHSWQQIGEVLGTSPQTAYQRFGLYRFKTNRMMSDLGFIPSANAAR